MGRCRSPIGLVIALCLVAPALRARQQSPSVPSPTVVFRDVAAAAGVNVTHVNGASPEKYFAEIMGSGGLFFDFDDDGWIDIFIVDGGSIADVDCVTIDTPHPCGIDVSGVAAQEVGGGLAVLAGVGDFTGQVQAAD